MARHLARIAIVVVGAVLAGTLAGCEDLVIDALPRAGLEPAPGSMSLDFGEVEARKKATRILEIRNRGSEPVELVPTPPEPPWSWDLAQEKVVIPGGGPLAEPVALRITFEFNPGTRNEGLYSGEARLVGEQVEYRIGLQGRAIGQPIVCWATPAGASQTVLDIGTVVIGESRTESIHCHNKTARSRRIEWQRHPQGNSCFEVAPGTGASALDIPARDVGKIDIQFTAREPAGPVHEFLPISLRTDDGGSQPAVGGNGIELTGIALPTHVLQFGDPPTDPTLDFGFVPRFDSATLSLVLRNTYDRGVTIQAVLEEEDSGFSLLTVPQTLGPNGDITDHGPLGVRFAPTVLGHRTGHVRLWVKRDDAPEPVEDVVELRGFGGGPQVTCAPGMLPFGRVAVGAPVVGVIECRNVGEDLASSPEDDLEFVDVRTGRDVFSAVPRHHDGGLRVEVTYRPIAPGFDSDTLEVVTCAGAGCAAAGRGDVDDRPHQITPVQLTGRSEIVPPDAYCDALFEPAGLDFGRLDPEGGEGRLTAHLVNRGTSECLVSAMDIDIEPRASPGFDISGRPTTWWVLPAGSSRPIQVALRPDAVPEGEVFASARVYVSNPDPARSPLVLPVRASIGGSCLAIEPPTIDFTIGTERKVDPALSCGAPDVTVTVRNRDRCAGAWRVTGIVPVAGSAPAFSVPTPAALPVDPLEELGFAVKFRPVEEGTFYGGIHVFAEGPDGEAEARFLPLSGEAAVGGTWFDRLELVKPKLDVLLVLASSLAMRNGGIVANLVSPDRIEEMRSALGRPDLDWQLGITSTDTAGPGLYSCDDGMANGGEAGRLVPTTGPGPRILVPGHPAFAANFTANVKRVRPCPIAERAFDAVVLALSEPLFSGFNAGLVRDGGHLAVLFVSTGDDASPSRGPSSVIDVLGARKAPGLFSTWAILGDPTVGSRYAEVVQLTDQASYLADEPESWEDLWRAAGNLASRSQATYRLSAPTSGASAVRLTYVRRDGASIPLPDGWRLVDLQAIELGYSRMQELFEEGGHLEAVYPLVCAD